MPSQRDEGAQPQQGAPGAVDAKLSELEREARSLPGAEAFLAGIDELRTLLHRDASVEQRVEARVADRTRELASLSEFLQTHGEREKASLARELHDSLGGILTPAKMDLAWLEAKLGKDPQYADRLARLSALIDQGIDLKRRIIETLRPSLLDHLGLASALQWYVDEACRDAGIECHLDISDSIERMAPDMEIALYRLVQESVRNIVKHANAKTLGLELERAPDGLRLTVRDDGVGIGDLERAKKLSHGLAGMMLRVRSVGGTFDVHTAPNKGTRIDVFVPLAAKVR